jgi:hypothetical protein
MDSYEFPRLLIPGSVALFGFSLLHPEILPFIHAKEIAVGDLGLFGILAYATGHLVQAIGHGLESLFWHPFGGKPTDWPIQPNTRGLLSKHQYDLLQNRVQTLLEAGETPNLPQMPVTQWHSIVRQIQAVVRGDYRRQELERTEGAYLLCRGLAAAFLIVAALHMWSAWSWWHRALALLLCAALAMHRMYRSGIAYARELFMKFSTPSKLESIGMPASSIQSKQANSEKTKTSSASDA